MDTQIKWMYDGHREAMKGAAELMGARAIRSNGTLDREYATALYLLTGMEDVWPRIEKYVKSGIDHEGMLGEALSGGERLIVALSGNLFNEGVYIDFTPVDLIDRLDDDMFELAINGIILRRGNPTLAMLEEEPI